MSYQINNGAASDYSCVIIEAVGDYWIIKLDTVSFYFMLDIRLEWEHVRFSTCEIFLKFNEFS